jgi:hypothetical protein
MAITTPSKATEGTVRFHYKRISWAAIFAGAMVALGIQLLLSLLGIGIGMGSIDPLRERNPMAGLGISTLVWWAISLLLALYAGGWVAGKLSRTMNRFESIMHGILTWIVFVLFNIYLLSSAAGSIMNAAGGVMSNTVSLVGQGVSAASPVVADKLEKNDAGIDRTGITTDSSAIQSEIDKLKAKAPEAEAKAREVGDALASSLSKAGIYSFVGLLLGVFIAAVASNAGRGNVYERDEYEYR